MDSRYVVQQHRDNSADIAISYIPIGDNRAFVSGLIKIDDKGQVLHFYEKPKGNKTCDVCKQGRRFRSTSVIAKSSECFHCQYSSLSKIAAASNAIEKLYECAQERYEQELHLENIFSIGVDSLLNIGDGQ